MAETIGGKRGVGPWRLLGWGGAGALLLLPLVARAPWTLSDFIVAGAMLGGAGLLIELAVRASGNWAYRAGAGFAVLAGLLLIWVNGAVGFLGDEDNPANLMFAGVLLIAVLGTVLAGFRPAGMARAMFATAGAQVLVAAIALVFRLGSPGNAGLFEAVFGTAMFVTLWLISAGLYRKAATDAAG